MKIIEGKVTGRGFGGDYIKTNDGRLLWKGDRNNYVEDRLSVQMKNRERASSAQRAPQITHGLEPSNMLPRFSFLDGLMTLVVGSAVIAAIHMAMLCLMVVVVVGVAFYAPFVVLSQYISIWVGVFSSAAFVIPLIVFSAALIFLIYYWIHCIHKIKTTGQVMSIRYAIICVICMVLAYMPMMGFSLSGIPTQLLYGVAVAALPTIVLCYLEYKIKKGKNLLRSIAQRICKGKRLRRVISVGLGVMTILFSVMYVALDGFHSTQGIGKIINDIGMCCSYLFAGIVFILIGYFGTEPDVSLQQVDASLQGQDDSLQQQDDSTMDEEWFTLTAQYDDKTYMCMFKENGQYQDISSNEIFYYHGGVEPDLGESSGFNFLVFTVFDDCLVAVLPMDGVTPDNYDTILDAMIERFENSASFQELSDYHIERCAKILIEQEHGDEVS